MIPYLTSEIHADYRHSEELPIFSVLVATYNVDPYIEDALESFKQQSIDSKYIEYILVDDGSTDLTFTKAITWLEKNSLNAVLISAEHHGVATTRATALSYARGIWVTSVDPDDAIAPNYFTEVQRFIEADTDNQLALISTRPLIAEGFIEQAQDTHPLGEKFRRGNRVTSMLAEPSAVQMGATSFLRRAILEQHNLTYQKEIQPTFEDGNLICRYLAHFPEPIIGLVATAHYYYRKRIDKSSLVQRSWQSPHRYTTVLRHGYLDALKYMTAQQGHIPNWLAFLLLYDLMWYFKEDRKMGSVTGGQDHEVLEEFLQLAQEIFTYFTAAQVINLPFNKPDWNLRETLLTAYLESKPGRTYRYKTQKEGFATHSLYTTPGEHFIEIFVDSQPVTTDIQGITQRHYFGKALAQEIKLKIPEGRAVIMVDRERLIMSPPDPALELPQQPDIVVELNSRIAPDNPHTLALEKAEVHRLQEERASLYTNCWLLLDHPERADDNAEHLYRYLAQKQSHIKVYFLLNKDSKDWARLESEGFNLLDYSSTEAKAATLSAAVLASSDAVEECMYPAPRKTYGKPGCKFVFLQHGIAINNISAWLNPKAIDLMLCSSRQEYDYLVWRNSPYELTQQQVALTGLPRFDALKEQDAALSTSRTNKTLTIMPTWRKNLADILAGSAPLQDKVAAFQESDFYRAWWNLLKLPQLQRAIAENKLKVRFALHPNISAILPHLEPVEGIDYVRLGEQGDSSFQEFILSTDIFMTDYSTVIFDYAYINRPVLYYHYDSEDIFKSQHTVHKGYFDYSSDAIGPVAHGLEELWAYLLEAIDNAELQRQRYSSQLERAFAYRDTNNAERAYLAIEALLHQDYEHLKPAPSTSGE